MNSSPIRLWNRVPVMVRAILTGLLVLLVGISPWSVLVNVNIKMTASVPWAFPIEVLYLWLLLAYLSGKGWPESTSETRCQSLRANPLTNPVWKWSLIAGALFSCGLFALTVVGWKLVGFPRAKLDEYASLSAYPIWSVLALLLTGSLVAGIIEEVGFRGYMQGPIERRHGPTIAITVVAVIFSLAHFPTVVALPGLLLGGVGWGLLAHLTDSILPGILFHSLIDAVGWLWVWQDRTFFEGLASGNVLENGVDAAFTVSVLVAVCIWTAAILAFRKLAKVCKRERLMPPAQTDTSATSNC